MTALRDVSLPEPIRLHVVGIPAPQGSKTAMPRRGGGKPILVEGGSAVGREKHRSWRQAVAQAVRDYLVACPREPLAEVLAVEFEFFFPVPASDPYRAMPGGRPDLSKLIRSTEDALVDGGLIGDDSRIVDLDARKLYARGRATGADITVQPLGTLAIAMRDQLKLEAAEARRGQK